MFQQYTYFPILGLPAVMYVGIIGFVFFGVAIYLVTLYPKKSIKLVKLHRRLAMTGAALVLVHGILGILAYV